MHAGASCFMHLKLQRSPMCLPRRPGISANAVAALASPSAGSDDGSEGLSNTTPSILRKTATSYKPGDAVNVPWRPPGLAITVR